MNKELKIALGCGRTPIPGFIGVDITDHGWNQVCDISTQLLPFENCSADFIQLHNTLEHIERKYWRHLFNEMWRVCKDGGYVEIITPDAGVDIQLALADPTHVSFVVKGTFTQYLTGGKPRNADYGFKKWYVECRNYVEKEPRDIYARLRPNRNEN